MKRYLAFSGEQYYPSGGMEDFKRDFDTEEEAMVYVLAREAINDWMHVYDSVERKIIWKTGCFGSDV